MTLRNIYNTISSNIFLQTKNVRKLNKIFTHLTKKEKMVLYKLARKKTGTFVEIGSYLGASSCFIAAAQINKNPSPKLYCIDTWTNEGMSEGEKDTYEIFLENTKAFRKIIHPLRGRSTVVAEQFQEKIDFLFIDGDHSYEGVTADIKAWFPKLKNDAYVLFHDVGWAEGVIQAIAEHVEPIAKKTGRLPNLYWAFL